ncbi:uncharacterized protein ISCGN_017659 [Ixodes scapularis]
MGGPKFKGESVINFVVATPQPVFYTSIETSTNRHTASYISGKIFDVIDSLESGKVVALVTDNASNMQAACQMVTCKFPHIATIGCADHGLNLLLNDLMRLKTLEKVHQTSREVIKNVKQTQVVAATFQQKQESRDGKGSSTTLKLPSKTRWGGVTLSLQSLLSNKEALQETVILEDLKVNKSVRQAVLGEDGFWKHLRSCFGTGDTHFLCHYRIGVGQGFAVRHSGSSPFHKNRSNHEAGDQHFNRPGEGSEKKRS